MLEDRLALTAAYVVPAATVGNQTFAGALGMDFDVVQDISVPRLGVFDSGGNGLNSPISVRLYNRDTQAEVASVLNNSGTTGSLVGGSRFYDLATPLVLSAGFHGTIVAEGYGPSELNGNETLPGAPSVSTDSGGGLISFVGSGRFGNAGSFPSMVLGANVNPFAAGTFDFTLPGASEIGVPSVTDATTNEDTQTTSGLVITRNAADGNEVTHFQITNITNGKLFLNDGTTQIVNGSFITVAQGNAGLKFTPNSNFFGTSSFNVQASLSASDVGLGGSVATATITVNPVADTPSLTNSTTIENTQTTSGLVISRNAVDSTEVTHFKITNITNGTLFLNNGTTPIANGTFITFAQGAAGLKFTPSNGFFGTGSFDVQASQSNSDADLGGSVVTASITVNGVANTPSVTNATTNEDTQSTSGLVITRNAADGNEVTHFKVTNINNGTLFLNNGTTQIVNGSFITVAQGNAGLKFTPSSNFFGTGSFGVQASVSATDAGLGGSVATATITINPVADTPSVTNAATTVNTQTTSGLVVSRNAVDSTEVTHFKITNITNGTLFQNDGTTPIANGTFITFAQGNAGLKFTPSNGFFGTGSFDVQASQSNSDADLGGSVVTATITVNVASALSTTTTLSSSDNNSLPGQDVTFTATVSVVGGTPTGTVTFKIDGSGGGVVPVDGVGQASFSTSTLTLGSHTITADYASNNPSFSDSSAAPLTQTVSQVATTTLLVSSDSTSSLGQPVTFTATVASAEAGLIPTGTVTFFVAGNNVVVPLDGSGQASFSTSTLPIGTFTANAAYTSNSIVFLDSTSPPITQTVTGELAECTVETLNSPGSPGTATLEDDADNPGSGVLIVTGTAGNDTIVVERSPRNRSQLLVLRNGRAIGTFNFADVQHIVAFGLAGNDRIIVSAGLSQPATLFGDEGNDYLYGAKGADGLEGGGGVDRLFGGSNNDTLCGGDGNDFVYGQAGNDFAGGDAGNDKVFGEGGNDFLLGNDGNDQLYGGTGNDRAYGQAGNDQVFGETGNDIGVGGDGNDKLFGGSGRDVLIGGDGLDILFGEAHDDILVAGSTSHDEDDEALLAILAEWTSANGYTTRVNNIRSGGGANGAFTLDDTTVIDDGLVDTLWGDGGLDWFLFGDGDKLKDKASNELVN